ncbi:MAG: 50S ribosomal protein L23 [Candidatus Taylorbacteria bacterium]|nr:50S ribosomal protein L23 [Candidatus Taylorbacteria bacterium]
MGILNLKKNKVTSAPEAVKEAPKAARKLSVLPAPLPSPGLGAALTGAVSGVLIRPRVTEKAGILSEKGRSVYVFEVSRAATKRAIAEAVRALYKVTPEKVAVLKIPPKKSFVRGRVSYGKTGRKAYVYLKAGGRIENL